MDCGLQVETRYAGNEFSALDDESLHMLRIFVACEGRIRDMEAALGVSYPTVKTRLAELRTRLGVGESRRQGQDADPSAGARDRHPDVAARAANAVAALERGDIDYAEAVRRIKGDGEA